MMARRVDATVIGLIGRPFAPGPRDPHVPRLGRSRHYQFDLESAPLTAEALRAADAVLIVTDHSRVDYALVVRHAAVVVDTRNTARDVPVGRGKVVKA